MPIIPDTVRRTTYEIVVAGRIAWERADWFGGMALTVRTAPHAGTITLLSGPLADQAALFGVLNRIRDLVLKLVSVSAVAPSSDIPTHPQPNQEAS